MSTAHPDPGTAKAVAATATTGSYVAPHLAHWPRRLPRELSIPSTSLWFNLEVSAARYPHKAAYLFLGNTLSFGELKDQAQRLAAWLQRAGLAAGDRVALFMQNCPQFVIAFYAVHCAGGVVVPVNPMNRADEFGHYIRDPQARVVVCAADLAGIVMQANAGLDEAEQLPHLLVVRYADALPPATPLELSVPDAMDRWLRAEHPLPESTARTRVTGWQEALEQPQGQLQAGEPLLPVGRAPDDLAMLPYTSGTTGLPKGCMHTHRTLMSNVVGGPWTGVSADSVALAVVPMFHITGMMYSVLQSAFVGITSVLMPRWDRELAGRLISHHRVTHFVCIPTMIIDLFGSPKYRSFDLSSLVHLAGGGAAMPQAVAERVSQEFGLTFCEGYGLTETAAPSHGNPPERAKQQCLGMPIFGVDSRIIDPETLQVLPPGETGEIVTHGPMVFKGYWNHPQATAQAFIDIDGKSFFRTGDLGRMDEEGYFFITDRLKRMINASGFKVWPSEVELLMFKCPLVQEACVIGVVDAYRGETVKAFVVLRHEARGTARPEDVIGWAKDHMAAYKVPRVVEFVDALPKSGSGKVMWRLLQEQEQARMHAQQPSGA